MVIVVTIMSIIVILTTLIVMKILIKEGIHGFEALKMGYGLFLKRGRRSPKQHRRAC